VILDKLAFVKTVVHKTQAIDNTFRNFEMEVIAGETNFITLAREHGFSYKLDFSKVFWNPRLGETWVVIIHAVKNLQLMGRLVVLLAFEYYENSWLCGTVVERRSLAGELPCPAYSM